MGFNRRSANITDVVYSQGEVLNLLMKYAHEIHTSNWIDMNLREKAEFDSKFFQQNLKNWVVTTEDDENE